MTTKLAILQMADEPQIVSTALMLRHAGYEVKVCGAALRTALVNAGLDTVLAVSSMTALGYDDLDPSVAEATPADLLTCDLFVEIKVRNVPRLLERWPRLAGRVAYWRVNGAQPEICPKGGDEVNLPCPVITACLWYGAERYRHGRAAAAQGQAADEHLASRPVTEEELRALAAEAAPGAYPMAYTFWPPYPNSAEYDAVDRSGLTEYEAPYGLCHSVRAWGYGGIVDACVDLGVKFYGNNSPHGQVSHRRVPRIASRALALVHLKSVDCPGWALYEAILAGCPVVTGRMLNSRMLAYSLLEHGRTCYEFGVPASLEYGRGDMALNKCMEDIEWALRRLRDPAKNKMIGYGARHRLRQLMWTPERDGDSFKEFMETHFGR